MADLRKCCRRFIVYVEMTMIFLAAHYHAQQQEGSYSSAWDFTNASSKLDAVTQAQNSALISLFDPNQPPIVGADAEVGGRYWTDCEQNIEIMDGTVDCVSKTVL